MKKLLIGIGVLAVVIAVLGFLAPTKLDMSRSITINQPPAEVYNYLRFLKNGNQWSPWAKKDPNIVMDYRGTDGEVGSVSAWKGNHEVGVGEQEITNLTENSRIDLELRFTEPFEDTSQAYFVTEAAGENQTKVTWGMKGENEFPLNIICLVMNMEKQLAKNLDEGLVALKTQLEMSSGAPEITN